MANTFISYSRTDIEFARRLASDLKELGAVPWLDVESIRPAADWPDAIHRALNECQVMIVIVSTPSMQSINVAEEWKYFKGCGKPLIPVLIEPTNLHFQLHSLQHIDFYHNDYAVAFSELEQELQRLEILPTPTLPDKSKSQKHTASAINEEELFVQRGFSRKARIFWVLATTITLVCSIMAFLLWILDDSAGEPEQPTVPTVQLHPSDNAVYVAVATQNLPRGIRLTGEMVFLQVWPAEVAPEYSFQSTGELLGYVSRTEIPRGSLILKHQLYWDTRTNGPEPTAVPDWSFSYSLPPGEYRQPTPTNPFSSGVPVVEIPSGYVEYALALSPRVKLPSKAGPGDRAAIIGTLSQQDVLVAYTTPLAFNVIITKKTSEQLVLAVRQEDVLRLSDGIANGGQITLVILAADNTVASAPYGSFTLDWVITALGISVPEDADMAEIGK